MAGLAPVPREYWASMVLVGILTETSAIPWVSSDGLARGSSFAYVSV